MRFYEIIWILKKCLLENEEESMLFFPTPILEFRHQNPSITFAWDSMKFFLFWAKLCKFLYFLFFHSISILLTHIGKVSENLKLRISLLLVTIFFSNFFKIPPFLCVRFYEVIFFWANFAIASCNCLFQNPSISLREILCRFLYISLFVFLHSLA